MNKSCSFDGTRIVLVSGNSTQKTITVKKESLIHPSKWSIYVVGQSTNNLTDLVLVKLVIVIESMEG